MPAYQGEFDGLCGIYAIANAYEICGYGDFSSQLFETACSAVSHRRWPSVLWEGTSFRDMQIMISKCQDKIEIHFEKRVVVKYPFLRHCPNTNEDCWKRFDDIFQKDEVHCGIIGLTFPSSHWIVVSRDTRRRVWFFDSDANVPEYRKNIAALFAGNRRRTRTQWRICRKELLVFRGNE